MVFERQSGIAIGPILFIIALIAVLAVAVAGGNSYFASGTSTENASLMAQTILNQCRDYQAAILIMTVQNQCDITKLDYTPNNGWLPGTTSFNIGDYTNGNGTNLAGNGQCALFSVNGGGMNFRRIPLGALVSNPTGAYTTYDGSASSQYDLLAGYPIPSGYRCYAGIGTCSNATPSNNNGALTYSITYVSPSVCTEINTLLGISVNMSLYANHMLTPTNTLFGNAPVVTNGYTGGTNGTFTGPGGIILPNTEGCTYDTYSNGSNTAYDYTCPLMVR